MTLLVPGANVGHFPLIFFKIFPGKVKLKSVIFVRCKAYPKGRIKVLQLQ